MTVRPRTTNGPLADILQLNPFARNDHFWWAYPSLAKAFIDNQKAAFAYLQANSKLMDEIRDILGREFDLSLQIFHKMLEGASETNHPAMAESSDVNAIFDGAIASWHELGEAWMNAQERSLDAMRRYASNGGKRHPRE
jgi:hypothetical protein